MPRPAALAILGLAALAAVVVLGVAAGSVAVAPGDTIGILLRAVGFPLERTWAATAETIVLELRLPRVLTAVVVGAGLAVAGATFQGLLRNPLADPYVLGTASGAALGAAIAVLIPVRIALLGLGLVNVLAFAGGLAAVAVVYRLGRGGPLAPLTGLLLTGYAVGSLLAAGLAMTMYLSRTGPDGFLGADRGRRHRSRAQVLRDEPGDFRGLAERWRARTGRCRTSTTSTSCTTRR